MHPRPLIYIYIYRERERERERERDHFAQRTREILSVMHENKTNNSFNIAKQIFQTFPFHQPCGYFASLWSAPLHVLPDDDCVTELNYSK